MTKVEYKISKEKGVIYWVTAEEFGELSDREYRLGDMEAKDIAKLVNLSETTRILLSAVAGAIIQHLIDKGVDKKSIFLEGKFVIVAK